MTVIATTSRTTATRAVGLDALRVGMAVMVIGLHGHVLADIAPRASYLLVEGLFRVAVPVFFIISGFYLQGIRRGGFGRWLRHLLILYLLWMAIYGRYWWGAAIHDPGEMARRLFFGYYHLWFLAGLICGGTLLIGLRRLSSRSLLMAGALLAAVGVAIQYAGNYHLFPGPVDAVLNQANTYRNFLFFGFPFLVIGFLLGRHDGQISLTGQEIGLALAIGLMLLLLESSMNLRLLGAKEPFDLLLSLYIAAPALFLAAREVRMTGPGKQMALFATGIYLVHIMLLKQLAASTSLTATPIVVLTIAISMVLAAVLVWVNRRLPIL